MGKKRQLKKRLKAAISILKEILKDTEEQFNTGNTELYLERMQANKEDIEYFFE